MSFAERMVAAAAFEQQVMDRLNASGWAAEAFGQGQLSLTFRDVLRRYQDDAGHPTLLRWLPDIITYANHLRDRPFVALIDAKACDGRPNYSVEKTAIETLELYSDRHFTPTFFVFNDWKVLTPREARQRGTEGPPPKNGSGTPYVLIPKQYGRPFDRVFPPSRISATRSVGRTE